MEENTRRETASSERIRSAITAAKEDILLVRAVAVARITHERKDSTEEEAAHRNDRIAEVVPNRLGARTK